jgi:hypothetical protein
MSDITIIRVLTDDADLDDTLVVAGHLTREEIETFALAMHNETQAEYHRESCEDDEIDEVFTPITLEEFLAEYTLDCQHSRVYSLSDIAS